MLIKILVKFWPHTVIFLFTFVFFSRLFVPEPGFFVTPDFARSDALHSNITSKLELSSALKSWTIPLWSNQVGQGFPLMAEGIGGYFYLPNLIIFGLFPTQWTIPLMYLSTFLICAFGMYLLVLKLKLPRFSAVIAALSYTYCASIILHVQHFNFIQAASLLPLILLLLLLFFERQSLRNFLFLAFTFSQLFFTGFVQLFTYSVLLFFLLVTLHFFKRRKELFKISFLYAMVVIVSLILSAVQLLPSLGLIQKSSRSEGLGVSYILKNFPMSFSDLFTYVNPFIRGSAKEGTANSTDWTNKGIFWESTSYIGILPLILVFVAIGFSLRKKPSAFFLSFIALALITTLLSLGKSAPTHFFYSFPPLSIFRVPSRFILFTQFFLVILAAFGARDLLARFPKKLGLPITISFIFLLTIDIFLNWWNYNPVGTFKGWITEPETARVIKKIDPNARVISLGVGENWNGVFIKSGWKNGMDDYLFFRNGLDQNINLLFGINQFNVFETLPSRRYKLQNTFLFGNIEQKDDEISINEKARAILDGGNVKFIITPKIINDKNYDLAFETERNGYKYRVYKRVKDLGIAKIYFDFRVVNTVEEYEKAFSEVDLEKTVIIENAGIDTGLDGAGEGNVKVKNMEGDKIEFEVETGKPGIFTASISNYPGWKTSIDGHETRVVGANINSLAVGVPAGKHIISFSYQNKSFLLGLFVSSVTYLILIGLVAISFKKKPF